MAAIAPSARRHRLLHELAAQVHQPHRVRERSAPAATSALHSPSECPADGDRAAAARRASSTRSAAMLVARMAGCVGGQRELLERPFEAELRQ